jgi:hypothetical protein
MASFSAQLLVAGHTYPVRHCTYEFTQNVGPRGRVMERVRMGLVQLTLDVPPDDFLPGWAATPNQPLAGQVVFFAAQGGSALETLGWETGQCVGYREEFAAGDQEAGAYVCHLTIAAPKLAIQPGGPLATASAEVTTGVLLETTLLKAEELASGLVKKVITPAGELGTEILGIGAATLAHTVSLTAGLVLTPTNSPTDPGYRSEWDLSRLTQVATDQDRARLDHLEAAREHRALSEAEEDELATLLAVVRKVFVGGRRGLAAYYTSAKTPTAKPVVRDATQAEAATIDKIRKEHDISKKKNVAYAEGILDGKPYYREAHSGRNSHDGTAPPKPFERQQLRTRPTTTDIARGATDPDMRAYDSEVKILEELLDQTADKPAVEGAFKLVSERPICESCWDGISQVEALRPNLKIERVQLPKP